MVRTKAYKRAIKKYSKVCELIEKAEKAKDKDMLSVLYKQTKELSDTLESLRIKHNVTFEYARKYGEELRKRYFCLICCAG